MTSGLSGNDKAKIAGVHGMTSTKGLKRPISALDDTEDPYSGRPAHPIKIPSNSERPPPTATSRANNPYSSGVTKAVRSMLPADSTKGRGRLNEPVLDIFSTSGPRKQAKTPRISASSASPKTFYAENLSMMHTFVQNGKEQAMAGPSRPSAPSRLSLTTPVDLTGASSDDEILLNSLPEGESSVPGPARGSSNTNKPLRNWKSPRNSSDFPRQSPVTQYDEIAEDPIVDSDEPMEQSPTTLVNGSKTPTGKTLIKPGQVQRQVAKIESRSTEQSNSKIQEFGRLTSGLPHINLREQGSRKNIMKPKEPQPSSEAGTSLPPKSPKKSPPDKIATDATTFSKKEISLGLEFWYDGAKRHQTDSDSSLRHFLTFSKNGPHLKIFEGVRGNTPLHPKKIVKRDHVKKAAVCQESHPIVLLVLDPLHVSESPKFRGEGAEFLLKFDVSEPGWEQSYAMFQQFLKGRNVEMLGKNSASAREEAYIKMADLQRVEKEPPTDKQDMPIEFDATSSAHSGSPSISSTMQRRSAVPRRKSIKDSPPDGQPRIDESLAGSSGPRKSARLSGKEPILEEEPLRYPLDKLILVYPPGGGTGAVNISYADFRRLNAGEFLNDNMIELGLKLVVDKLSRENPEIAEQTHVFNSFLYKKLNTRNMDQGYASVRKWTNKVDLFSKKYIIVPINESLHWYLAIICFPENILRAPILIPPRSSRRLMAAVQPIDTGFPAMREPASSEYGDEATKPSRKTSPAPSSTATEAEAEVEAAVDAELSPEMECMVRGASLVSIKDDPKDENDMDIDEVQEIQETSKVLDTSKTISPADGVSRYSTSGSSNLAGDVTPKGNQTENSGGPAQPAPEDDEVVVRREKNGESSMADIQSRTWIFTCDSLGGRHPQVKKVLNAYLVNEAKDKKQVEQTTEATFKAAVVPAQPNFCDCGVYLLGFVESFLSNPELFCRKMVEPKIPAKDRDELWGKSKLEKGREEFRSTVEEMSADWLKTTTPPGDTAEAEGIQVEGKNQAPVSEDDEDDIEILEDTTTKPLNRKAGAGKPRPRNRGLQAPEKTYTDRPMRDRG